MKPASFIGVGCAATCAVICIYALMLIVFEVSIAFLVHWAFPMVGFAPAFVVLILCGIVLAIIGSAFK